MNVCTIVARNYVAHARVLARSFQAAHADGRCFVLVVDDRGGLIDAEAEPFELIGIDEIGLPDPARMTAAYDVTELSTAVKPWLLRHLLEREEIDSITYLDPDIWIADSIAAIAELAERHEIVLIPHFTAPLPRDGMRPSEEDILIAGAYNLGFISLAAGDTAEGLLEWWSERLERHCVVDPGAGLFVDQRWVDLVPGIWPGVHILREPGYNVAYWNLPTRSFESGGDGFRVDGEPLRFFHFSGFDPLERGALSKHQNRIDLASWPALASACGLYADLLLESGLEQARAWSYGWESLPNGVRLDRAARRLYVEARDGGRLDGSVFEQRGAERFLSFLLETPDGGRVSRYARAMRDSRDDLRAAFPDVDGRDAPAFERWLHENAETLGISSRLLPPHSTNGGPHPGRGLQAGEPREHGVNLVGYLSAPLGVGEAARQARSALAARRLPVSAIDIPVEEARLPQAFAELGPRDLRFDVNLVCVNADMLPSVARAAPQGLCDGRHTVGLWFWEVERFPERWRRSFEHLDEVWTASEFVAEALRPLAPVPVRTVRIPVAPGERAALERPSTALPDGFRFLFVFDYRSVFQRKNPLGVVEAFGRAFAPGSGASLLIKSIHGDSHPAQAAELAAAAAGHADIHLLDGEVASEEKNALIAACDCYVSLHRSEGLGLTMAEAMHFGKPVIATGYSGNLDFMSKENSYLVEYDLEPVGDGAAPYPPSARWAEPSVEHAAELMEAVFENPEAAARKGARAAADIRASHSPEVVGTLLEERLAAARAERSAAVAWPAAGPNGSRAALDLAPSRPGSPAGATRLNHLLRFEQAPPRTGSGRVRAFFKRAYMRLLRPYAAHQRRIDISVRDAFGELGVELVEAERRLGAASELIAEGLREEIAELDRRLRDLDADARGACAVQAEELEQAIARLDAVERLDPDEALLAASLSPPARRL